MIVGVHGMNDYANAFHLAAPWWAEQGVTTYAYDQRGFGRSPGRGVWAGDDLMVEDLRTVTALVRRKYPDAPWSPWPARAWAAPWPPRPSPRTGRPRPTGWCCCRPAVWGWSEQPLPNKTAAVVRRQLHGPQGLSRRRSWLTSKVSPTDNRDELIAMGRDPLMIWGARSDTLYGLVATDGARRRTTWARPSVPTALPLRRPRPDHPQERRPFKAAAQLKPARPLGLLRQGLAPADRATSRARWSGRTSLAFIRDPAAPLPSGAPPIPRAPIRRPSPAPRPVAAGL